MSVIDNTMDSTDPKKQDTSKVPDMVERFYPSQMDIKKIKKKIRCVVWDLHKGSMPRVVYKPIDIPYGRKWFTVSGETYWIIYSLVKDFGKTYTYFVQHGNAVGGLSFKEHEEFADANQVQLMVNQHAVEVYKKNRGISQKLVLIIALIALAGIIGTMILVFQVIGANNQINFLKGEVDTMRIADGLEPKYLNEKQAEKITVQTQVTHR